MNPNHIVIKEKLLVCVLIILLIHELAQRRRDP